MQTQREMLTSVLQEKSEVYFICWYAKLIFFTRLFTESNAAILAIKYPCVPREQMCHRQLCSEVLKMWLIFSNWIIHYDFTKTLHIDTINLEKKNIIKSEYCNFNFLAFMYDQKLFSRQPEDKHS